MKKHILEEKAYTYVLPRKEPEMKDYFFDKAKGFWKFLKSNEPCIGNPLFAGPRTKKADVETGEDQKGE